MGSGGQSPSINRGPEDDIIICYHFCFSPQTIIEVLENGKLVKKKISLIKEGEMAQTYNGNSKSLTKVIKITRNKGIFEFYEFKCKDNTSNIKNITVTGNHTMIVFGKQNEIQFKNANQIKIGESFRTTDGILEIFEINKRTMKDCFEIRTEDGTILANDILVSTLYSDNSENKKSFQKILESSSNISVEILN